jgi:hypothetical protein
MAVTDAVCFMGENPFGKETRQFPWIFLFFSPFGNPFLLVGPHALAVAMPGLCCLQANDMMQANKEGYPLPNYAQHYRLPLPHNH